MKKSKPKIKVKPKAGKFSFENVPDKKKPKVKTVNESENVKNKLHNLIKETGTIADRKTDVKHPSGNTIEKTVIEKETPKQEPGTTTNQQQPAPSTPTQNQKENDAVAAMLNSAGMLIGAKKFNKVPEQCAMTPDEVASIHDLQPEGGLHTKSWLIYFLAASSLIAMKIMQAPEKGIQKSASMDDLIKTMEAQGYKIERPERDLNPMITELQKHGYTITKNGMQEANVIS